MKLKLFTIILLAFILFSAVSANEYNFTIPDNYTIHEVSENFTLLKGDRYHSISMSLVDVDRDVLKSHLENSMYDFIYVDNYTKGDWNIEENWYNQEYQRGILYFCDNGEDLIVIDYKGPLDVDLEDSPVGVILDSLE